MMLVPITTERRNGLRQEEVVLGQQAKTHSHLKRLEMVVLV